MLRRRVLFLALVSLVLLAACGQVPTPNPTPAGRPTPLSTATGLPTTTPAPTGRPAPTAAPGAGISGVVLVGPACPVIREGELCPDKPYPATLIVLDKQGQEVARVQAGADGRFQVELAPGAYTLVPQQPKDSPLPHAPGKIDLMVTAGEYVSTTVTYDSGIR